MNHIISMGARYGACRSLKEFERALYEGKPIAQGSMADPTWAALDALEDAPLGAHPQVGVIKDETIDMEKLRRSSSDQLHVIDSLRVRNGSIFKALKLARSWLDSHPSEWVMIALGTEGGAGAILLEKPPSRTSPGYATVEALAIHAKANRACKTALDQAGISPALLGILEFLQPVQEDEFSTLNEISPYFPLSEEEGRQTVIGSLAPIYPEDTGIGGLIKTALAIHRRSLYGVPVEDETFPPEPLKQSSFYLPPKTRPWLDSEAGVDRMAAVLGRVDDGQAFGQLILRETTRRRSLPRERNDLHQTQVHLIPFEGRNRSELQKSLGTIRGWIDQGQPMPDIASNAYAKIQQGEARWAGSLLARDHEQLLKELDRAQQGMGRCISTEETWTTPRGSTFTSNPLGKNGVAFVYPGAFNSYPGMGRDLFQIFPSLHEKIHVLTDDISHSLAESFLYPRNLTTPNKAEKAAHAKRFFKHPVELIESGISLSVIHTLILKDIFNVHPKAAFGYSLGEISMLWANNIWQNASQSSKTWQHSPLFKKLLFGPKLAVRNFWNMDPTTRGDDFWGSYILKASRDDVKSATEKQSQAFLTIINAPGEVVIAGLDPACQKVISDLDCHALPMPFDAVIHNPAMKSTYDEFVDLYTNEVLPNGRKNFYSAAHYRPLHLEKDELARQIAKMTCEQVDFPRLVKTVYEDGPQIFIEVGPQKTCSRWIENILHDHPHAVIPINKKYQADREGVLKVLSLLHSHQVALDLSPLYSKSKPPRAETSQPKPSRPIEPDHTTPFPSRNRPPAEPTRGDTETVPRPEGYPHSLKPVTLSDSYARYYQNLDLLTSRIAKSHRHFLIHQEQTLNQMGDLVRMKLAAMKGTDLNTTDPQKPLFTEEDIRAFTLGDPQECFGPSYAVFKGRRIPRLPNGPFRFIDRVIELEGDMGNVEAGSGLLSEVEIPENSWVFPSKNAQVPIVALMEVALQPCGFLSAYLGSTFDKPHTDFYFRNLDGEGRIKSWPQLRGKTITNHVKLLSTSRMGEIIIQKYAFQLACEGHPFFEGKTSFGYFTAPALDNQVGLDQGHSKPTWKEENPQQGRWVPTTNGRMTSRKPSRPRLPSIERAWVAPQGGENGRGYIYLQYPIHPEAWYFDAHFHQDPVMPGSLGVEIMARAIHSMSTALDIGEPTPWHIKPGVKVAWGYRGQVTRMDQRIQIELHIKDIQRDLQKTSVIADGSLWNDKLRIYHIENLALETAG